MFTRISNLLKGFISLFISGLERQNPEALIEVEKENLRKQISEYNKGLAAHAALCERLMSQVKKMSQEADQLKAKTAAHLKAGNRDAAGQLALRFKQVSAELTENRGQLEEAEKTYEELIRARDVSVKAARDKIKTLERDIDDMKMKSAMAELNEMAAGMVGQIGGSGDTLNRVHEMVQDERDKAAGRARVARDSIDTSEVQLMEQEQKAMEEMALADFAAEAGIALDSDSSSTSSESASSSESSSEKTM
ncbi:MAG: hypothetical protein AAF191_14720 [Verrucomicrobiota bacterium]